VREDEAKTVGAAGDAASKAASEARRDEARDEARDTAQDEAQDEARVRAVLIAVQLLFGINYLAAKVVVGAAAPAVVALVRVFLAFVILLGAALVGRRRRPPRGDVLQLGFCALFGVVLNQALFLEGLSRTTVGHSSLICAQIPLFALLAAVVLRQERLTPRKAGSFAAGLAGVLILLEADRFELRGEYVVGDLLTLANALSYGLYIALSRRVMARNDPLAATTVVFACGLVGMAIYGGPTLARGGPAELAGLTGIALPALAFVVLGGTVATYFLNLWALKRTHASHVALYVFLQPLVAATLGILVLADPLTLRYALAGALVFLALLLRDAPSRGTGRDAPRRA
jgi:drug/metabolite transporter (DMT)-like permease